MNKRPYPEASPAKSDDSFDDPIVFSSCSKRIRTEEEQPEPLTEVQNGSPRNTPTKKDLISDGTADDSLERTPSPKKEDTIKKRSPPVKLSADVTRNLFPVEQTPEVKLEFPSLRSDRKEFELKVQSIDRSEGFDLRCMDTRGMARTVFLQGEWESTVIEDGAEIRVIDPEIWDSIDLIVSDDRGLLIVQPNVLVPCTSVASSSWCARKVILNERYRNERGVNKSMLMGTVIHELFQIALDAPNMNLITHEWLLERWRECISHDVMKDLCALTFTPAAFQVDLQPYAEVIISWIREHIPSEKLMYPKPLPTTSQFDSVFDIEENVWDPLLGLKGKLDVTFKTKLKDGTTSMESLELKTGKTSSSVEHSTQVLLYSMMLSSRYDQDLTAGSLLYLKDGTSRPVIPKALELKGVLQHRNKLAHYLNMEDKTIVPEPRSDPHFCGKCEQSLVCSVFQQHVSNSKPATDGFRDFAKTQLLHISRSHIDYFIKWSKWIFREWNRNVWSKKRFLHDVWTLTPDAREARGSCASNMRFTHFENIPQSSAVMITFTREDPIRGGTFMPGSMCTVNSNSKYGLLLSFILKHDCNSITIRCERVPGLLKNTEELYHIDLYDSYAIYATISGNVAMMLENNECSERLRKWVINLESPRAPKLQENVDILGRNLPKSVNRDGMNEEQLMALISALTCEDYFLIQGLPGTGKSTVIVNLILCLIAQGKSVLLTSYTNSAVDNILAKLSELVNSEHIVRLGKGSSVHPDAEKFTLESRLTSTKGDIEQYKETRRILSKTAVVACTCYHAAKDSLFSWRKFDICIVDEAAMVLEPFVLAPISAAARFVLVGDTKQLSPLVQDPTARAEGMNVSLFERLQVHNHVLISLVRQYRMNSDICNVASKVFYDGEMYCGNSYVADSIFESQSLNPRRVVNLGKGSLLKGEETSPLVLFDTGSRALRNRRVERQGNGVIYNSYEADIVDNLIVDLINLGVNPSDIGVMCVYRGQVDLIRKKLKYKEIEVNTVDQYQGRDKSIIIWSTVWTANFLIFDELDEKISDLLADARRVNVAITRAKHKLLIVGCKESMARIPIMQEVTSFFHTSATQQGFYDYLLSRAGTTRTYIINMDSERRDERRWFTLDPTHILLEKKISGSMYEESP